MSCSPTGRSAKPASRPQKSQRPPSIEKRISRSSGIGWAREFMRFHLSLVSFVVSLATFQVGCSGDSDEDPPPGTGTSTSTATGGSGGTPRTIRCWTSPRPMTLFQDTRVYTSPCTGPSDNNASITSLTPGTAYKVMVRAYHTNHSGANEIVAAGTHTPL